MTDAISMMHTAPPYSYKECGADPTLFQLLNVSGEVIGFMRRGTGGKKEKIEREATAEFVVHACNSFESLKGCVSMSLDREKSLQRERDALVKALQGARQALRKSLPYLPADTDAVFCGEWLDEINTALAKSGAA